MTDQYVGEIRILPYSFAPLAWARCDGQLLSVSQNTPLFAILGTTYGGNGQTNFALPDLQERAPIHRGTGPGLTPRGLGQRFGTSTVTLTQAQMPGHRHSIRAADQTADETGPGNHTLANAVQPGAGGRSGPLNMYAQPGGSTVQMNSGAMTSAGGGQAHENRQPFLAIQFCISLQGVFPTRS